MHAMDTTSKEYTLALLEDFRAQFGAEVVDRVVEDVARGVHAQKRLVMQQKAQIAEACRQVEAAAIGEIGLRPALNIPTVEYHYWGQRLGYQCWDDDAFLREWARDNPQFVVPLAKKTNSIIVPATKYTRLEGRGVAA